MMSKNLKAQLNRTLIRPVVMCTDITQIRTEQTSCFREKNVEKNIRVASGRTYKRTENP